LKEEQYLQTLYYIGLCAWLFAIIYFSFGLYYVVYDLIKERKLETQSSWLTIAKNKKSLSIKCLMYGLLVISLLTIVPKYLFNIAI